LPGADSWLERVERRSRAIRRWWQSLTVSLYDWDLGAGADPRLRHGGGAADAPVRHYFLNAGAVLSGASRRLARRWSGSTGSTGRLNFMRGHEPGPGLTPVGSIEIARECWVWTSARRYRAMGKRRVFGLYVRNFWSEILRHKPADGSHVDVRV
jgi:hypothetical protein